MIVFLSLSSFLFIIFPSFFTCYHFQIPFQSNLSPASSSVSLPFPFPFDIALDILNRRKLSWDLGWSLVVITMRGWGMIHTCNTVMYIVYTILKIDIDPLVKSQNKGWYNGTYIQHSHVQHRRYRAVLSAFPLWLFPIYFLFFFFFFILQSSFFKHQVDKHQYQLPINLYCIHYTLYIVHTGSLCNIFNLPKYIYFLYWWRLSLFPTTHIPHHSIIKMPSLVYWNFLLFSTFKSSWKSSKIE